jgi:ABC-type Mn2+/Zn2+ transport system permease subunit
MRLKTIKRNMVRILKKIGIVSPFYQKAFFISHLFGWISAVIGTLMILKRIEELKR